MAILKVDTCPFVADQSAISPFLGGSGTADPTQAWGDNFECCFKAQSSKLESLISLKRGKRDVQALSFQLSKMSPKVGFAVPAPQTRITTNRIFLRRNILA
jgi:hypothetical protein